MPADRLRVTVMGLGLFDGGVAVTRYLVDQGHDVLVTDLKEHAALERSVAALEGLPVRLRLGGHEERDFVEADVVVVNPAVPPGNRFVDAARAAGVRLETEIGLFVRACPARIVGVTGTAGKSTTSALLAACLEPAAEEAGHAVFLGGNIGRSLLRDLEVMAERDIVVLELSSFQLHWLGREGLKPHAAVFTNLTPNHLDWHTTFEAYRDAKSAIVPRAGGVLVACHDDPEVRRIVEAAPCDVVWTSRDEVPGEVPAVFWRGGTLAARGCGDAAELLERGDVRLLGDHAAWNVASAAAAAIACGARPGHVRQAVLGFDGLPHRLRPVGTFGGVLCVDDSKSTTPAATVSALRAFERPVILLAGGYDKGLDPAPLVAAAASGARLVVCYGTTGPRLAADLRAAGGAEVRLAGTLAEAVAAALRDAREGDVLLLSPGHASWDQFENYEERGRVFGELVRAVRPS